LALRRLSAPHDERGANGSLAANPVIVVHGGAGEWPEGTDGGMQACREAAEAGREILANGGQALDAVIAAVKALEDAPACNAGTGAVLTSAGTLELDACAMDGATLASGAVAALPPFRHPIDVAKAVLEDGRYHLLVAAGAAEFAVGHGFTPADPETMITPEQRAYWERAGTIPRAGNTVGGVALDSTGRLAAATSTGGLAGTLPGRVGDSPIVGGGTYANAHGACSCTGDGESFARACAAFWAVEALAGQTDHDPPTIAERLLARVKSEFHGTGGVILLDAQGQVGVAKSAPFMPYVVATLDSCSSVALA
jgi:L-asparaginase / beta-aspartyl-peptidase